MNAHVDIWWMLGSEIATPADSRINCRAFSAANGLPASWRTGERARFAQQVLARYGGAREAMPAGALARGWRLNSGAGAHVSLTDTGTFYVIGVGRGVPLGIDAEVVRPVDDAMATLQRLGLDRTVAMLRALAPRARNDAFLKIWTAFESYLKLERLPWEVGAQRFAAMEQHWSIGREGTAQFQRGRAGVVFEHAEVENKLVVGVATPVPTRVELKRMIFPLRRRAASGIASTRAQR